MVSLQRMEIFLQLDSSPNIIRGKPARTVLLPAGLISRLRNPGPMRPVRDSPGGLGPPKLRSNLACSARINKVAKLEPAFVLAPSRTFGSPSFSSHPRPTHDNQSSL